MWVLPNIKRHLLNIFLSKNGENIFLSILWKMESKHLQKNTVAFFESTFLHCL